mmetsp:Transcript_10408/g.31812  ORF Transcript_10408/g.31812 Transcript_10408/m.31812 type:complete len:349 (+) Transcript_10408:74-1120(+)
MDSTVEVEVFCADDKLNDEMSVFRGSLLNDLSAKENLCFWTGASQTGGRETGRFQGELCMQQLNTRVLGQTLVWFSSVASTQDVVRSRLRTLIPGVVVVAEEQRSGRGRRGASWESPKGCLTFSVGTELDQAKAHLLPFLQYVAALAAVQAIEAENSWRELQVRIKWPNDLLLKDKKVGGILCEGISVDGRFLVSIGVGINISNERPSVCLKDALQSSSTLTAEHFLAVFLNQLEPLLQVSGASHPVQTGRRGTDSDRKVFSCARVRGQTLTTQGFGSLSRAYYDRWLHSNQTVFLENRGGKKATVQGLSDQGAVTVRTTSSGEVLELDPYETSLDLETSTVRAKSSQ